MVLFLRTQTTKIQRPCEYPKKSVTAMIPAGISSTKAHEITSAIQITSDMKNIASK